MSLIGFSILLFALWLGITKVVEWTAGTGPAARTAETLAKVFFFGWLLAVAGWFLGVWG